MKIRWICWLIGICATLYTLSPGQPILSEIKNGRAEISDVPRVDWIYHIDAGDGYVAVITNDRKSFQLFGTSAKTGFSLNEEGNGLFFRVSMDSRSGFVLVGNALYEGSHQYVGYDYNGRVVLGPLETQNDVEIDPTGRFFYSVYDIGNDYNHPTIYDSTGNIMAEFKSSGLWDLKVLDPFHILFCDQNRIQVLLYPDMTVEKEIMPPHEHVRGDLSSAISPDGIVYAYVVYDKIFIIDLESGKISHVPNQMINIVPTHPEMAISSNGDYLAIFQPIGGKQAVRILQKHDTDYVQIVDGFEVPVPPGYAAYRSFAIGDSFCIVNYFTGSDNRIDFKSFVFEFPQGRTDSLAGEALDGLATIDSSRKPQRSSFRVTDISPGAASTRLVKIRDMQ